MQRVRVLEAGTNCALAVVSCFVKLRRNKKEIVAMAHF